ncbi:MAG: ComF family protein [Candidatus Limivicinus sp.]
MSGWSEKLLDLLYPPKCAFCRKLTEDGSLLCPSCGKTIERTGDNAARRDIPHLALCLSPLYYTGAVQKSLQRYKFHGGAAYYRLYAGLMAECIRAYGETYDRVCWVPLSRKSLRQRGYDQAELLAEEVGRQMNLPCERLLVKIRNNRTQSRTGSMQERLENVKGVYRCCKAPAGERILLVDDIVTTGATLSEAAGTLLDAGAKSVTGLTVARTPRDGEARTQGNGDSGYADF